MTGKRFTITQDFEEHHRQVRDNGKIIMGCFLEPQAEPIVKLLNELHEEIEYLKPLANENTQYIDDMEDDIITFKQKIKKLEKENKQLRTTLKELKEIGDYQADRIQELSDDNEQLKQKTQQVKDILKEYDDFEFFVDSAIAIGFIERIAQAVGMELEE